MAGAGIFVDGDLRYLLLESHIAEANTFFLIARSLSCLDSNVTELLLKIVQEPGYLSHLRIGKCLCDKLLVYLYTSCCCAARHLSFNLSSSLPFQLALWLQDQSIPGKNGRDQSEL